MLQTSQDLNALRRRGLAFLELSSLELSSFEELKTVDLEDLTVVRCELLTVGQAVLPVQQIVEMM